MTSEKAELSRYARLRSMGGLKALEEDLASAAAIKKMGQKDSIDLGSDAEYL